MYPAAFEYHRAASIEEAIQLLKSNDGAKVIAGGHSLIPMMKLRLAQPPTVIDIGRIEGLKGIEVDGDTLRVGALTTHAEIAASEAVQKHCGFLAEAAAHIGDPAVRNRGTVGGNIAHADPASDLPAVLRAAGATVRLVGPEGERSVDTGEFFLDLLATALDEHEIVHSVEVPTQGSETGSAYLKFEHPASGYAVVGAAAWVSMEGDRCTGAGLVFNGLAATPHVVDVSSLVGGSADDEAIGAIASGIEAEDPLSDVYASGEYRVHLARVYGKRALLAARDRARG